MKVSNRLALFDDKINIDIPIKYQLVDLENVVSEEQKQNIYVWRGDTDTVFVVQKVINDNHIIDQQLYTIKYELSQKFKEVKSLGVFKRKSRGFEQILSRDEYINEKGSIHCVLAVLKNNNFNLAVYQMMDKKMEKNNNESFEHIIDSIYEIHK